MREKRILMHLWNHEGDHEGRENIIQLFGTFLDDHNFSFVLEYPSNSIPLSFFSGKLDLKTIELVLENIIKGFRFLREKNVVHRDLKANNILLGKEPMNNELVLKIIDFGKARTIKGNEKTTTFIGVGHFTPPECLIREDCNFSFQSEIWCLGILIYELLNGEPPFGFNSLETDLINKMKTFSIDDIILTTDQTIINEFLRKTLKMSPIDRVSVSELFLGN